MRRFFARLGVTTVARHTLLRSPEHPGPSTHWMWTISRIFDVGLTGLLRAETGRAEGCDFRRQSQGPTKSPFQHNPRLPAKSIRAARGQTLKHTTPALDGPKKIGSG